MDEAMNCLKRWIVLVVAVVLAQGCASDEPRYGRERQVYWPAPDRQIWAVAPAINLSGEEQVNPLLQADLLFAQLQQVSGITVIPVNRVVEVYASLQIQKIQSEEQAALVCNLLGCDGLLVPTVTIYDPYNPPKFGAALHLFTPSGDFARPASVDVRALARSMTPGTNDSIVRPAKFRQAVGMFDAANGSVRQALQDYADGRHDPIGPLGSKEYLVSMDRFVGFAYQSLIEDLIRQR
jgi:hypothetical protein